LPVLRLRVLQRAGRQLDGGGCRWAVRQSDVLKYGGSRCGGFTGNRQLWTR